MNPSNEICIHIHEDDEGMRSLHPVQTLPDIESDLDVARRHSVENLAADGVGWTDIHIIHGPVISYAACGLTCRAAQQSLAGLMPSVKRFYATAMAGFSGHDPLGSYEEDAICFGFDETCFIKIDPAGELVSQIWFEARTDDPDKLAALYAAIVAVDRLAPTAIADYWLEEAGSVADTTFLDRYFGLLAEN